jgi:NitT/TauT family transport system ATP-binding protein
MIEVANLRRTYPTADGGAVTALTDTDLSVGDGEFISIVGPSGCGKSTLLRLLAGLDKPDAGRIELNGHAVDGASRDVGVVFQNATLLPWLSIASNVSLPLRVGGRQHGPALDTEELLEMAGLGGFGDKYPNELSGGMQQRAAICRALIRQPKVLLMDEPFGALDALTRERMNAELQRIWLATRKTVVLITHSISEAVFLADRVIVMSPRPGRVIADLEVPLDRPRDFADTPGHPAFIDLSRRVRKLLNDGDDK